MHLMGLEIESPAARLNPARLPRHGASDQFDSRWTNTEPNRGT
jgi:hypothetical protein